LNIRPHTGAGKQAVDHRFGPVEANVLDLDSVSRDMEDAGRRGKVTGSLTELGKT
jgi:hypothetical protein